MSSDYDIDHDAIFSGVRAFLGNVSDNIGDLEQRYNSSLSKLNRLDSGTNATLQAAMERNKQKALVTAEVLTKLLDFINTAAEQFQAVDELCSTQYMPTVVYNVPGMERDATADHTVPGS